MKVHCLHCLNEYNRAEGSLFLCSNCVTLTSFKGDEQITGRRLMQALRAIPYSEGVTHEEILKPRIHS